MKKLFIALTLLTAFGCNNNRHASAPGLTEKRSDTILTGGNKLIRVDGKYNVWTKKVGHGKIKVLLLHGGPGVPHDYLECFEDFLPKEGIEIYYYDQLGCGNSDIPTDTALWTIPRYVEEVEQVRKGLGLDQFYVVGQSWGGLLAMEYMKKYQSHVKGVVISNMTAGMKDFTDYLAVLKNRLFTPAERAKFDALDKAGKYESAEYNDLLMSKLYTQVVCRLPLDKWPEPLLRAFKKMNRNIYIQMQGVDEFHVTGNFKNWEFWDELPNIKVPVLVLGGKHDEMNPESIKREGQLLPNSRTYICPDGSHMAMYDDQQRYFGELTKFLKNVDEGTFTPDKK